MGIMGGVVSLREKENNSSLQLLNFLCTVWILPFGKLTCQVFNTDMCLCQVPPVPAVPYFSAPDA